MGVRVYVVRSIVATCQRCEWGHARHGTPVMSANDVATFNSVVNTHSKRHDHDVVVVIERLFTGKRA